MMIIKKTVQEIGCGTLQIKQNFSRSTISVDIDLRYKE